MAEILRIEFNESWWNKLGFDPGVEDAMDTIADIALAEAKAAAPVRTGTYKNSLHKETTRSPRRVIKRVASDDPKAVYVEARTSNLRKAQAKARRS